VDHEKLAHPVYFIKPNILLQIHVVVLPYLFIFLPRLI